MVCHVSQKWIVKVLFEGSVNWRRLYHLLFVFLLDLLTVSLRSLDTSFGWDGLSVQR